MKTMIIVAVVAALAMLQAADAATVSLNMRGSLAEDKLQANFASSQPKGQGTDWTFIAIGVGVLAVGAGAGGYVYMKNKGGGDEAKEAEGDDMAQQLVPDAEKGEDAGPKVDYAKMFQQLAEQVSSELGPELSKGGKVRTVLETRADHFTESAKSFLMNEMNGTAGAILKEIEAEEAMLLLDWNNAVDANFPPVPIIMAGVMSPTVLRCMAGHHWVQLITVGLPMFILCAAAIYIDWGAVCSIPTIFAWLYTQTILAFLMMVGHGCLLGVIQGGISQLNEKTQMVNERNARNAEGSFGGMRDQFIGSMVLLQEGLLIENGVRHSIWNIVVGVATIGWMISTFWNLSLIIGWTFVPGVVAFHPKAAEVAKGEFCGAWMTVIVLRVSMLLSVLYFFLNLGTVIQFLSDVMIESPSFSNAVLKQARDVDKQGVGMPVAEMLIKAFLLRGGSDTIDARLAVVQHEKASLKKEAVLLEGKIASLESHIGTKEKEVADLTESTKNGGDLAAACSHLTSDSLDTAAWKAQGAQCIQSAHDRAAAVQEGATDQLEALWDKIAESDAYKAVDAKAHEAWDTLNDPEFQAAMLAKAQEFSEQAQKLAAQAAEQAQGLAEEAMKMASDPELLKALQDGANEAMAAAQKAANEAAAAVNDPVLQAKLQKAAEEAFEQAKAKAQEVAETVTDPEMQEKLRKASMEAIEKAQDAAQQVVDAANDPELQKKIAETVEQASTAAQSAAQDASAAAQSAAKDATAAAQSAATEASAAADKAVKKATKKK